MNDQNYILAYYQQISDGSATVGRWIRLLYEMIVSGIENGEYIFNQQKANRAVRFIETFCRHNKGRLAPGLLKLELFQKAFISILYGIMDKSGKRQFTEVAFFVGRKCGKTLLASAIIAYEAYVDGEFGSEIYCIAPKLEQSDLVFSAFEFTKDKSPDLSRRIRKRKTDYIIDATNTTIKKIAFSEKKADGYNPMLTVADEMSSWPGDRGLRQYEVMVSGTGARKEPITLSISSGGYVNEGIYDELFKRGTRVLLGDSTEKHLLPVFYTIDDPAKWDDINELRKSIPGLGVSVSVQFILDEIEVARGSLSKKAEFLTKYCCVKQSSSMAWLPADAVERAYGEPLRLEDFRDTYALAGLDLSRTTDLTSACVLIQKGGKIYIFSKFWLPAEKISEATARDGLPYQAYIQRGILEPSGDNFVDYKDCFKWFRDLIEKYHVYPLMIGYDRYSAQYLVQDLQAYGFQTDSVFQGYNLTPAINTFEGMLRDGNICIGDNDLLKVHLLDSALKKDADTERSKLVKLRTYGHIDGTAAVLDAMIVRDKYWSEMGDRLSNEG